MADEDKSKTQAQTNPAQQQQQQQQQPNVQQASKPAEQQAEVKDGGLKPGDEGTFPADPNAADNRVAFKDLEDGTRVYKLRRGKHMYVDKDGVKVTAVVGDYIPLTPSQAEALSDRVITE